MKPLETKSSVLLKHHLKALKLPSIHQECEKIAARCARENVDHLGFLLQLCELELLDRERRAAQRRLKAARFPNYKTLEDFDFTAQPSINKPLLTELMRCDYIQQRHNVLFVGNPGTGKTHCAIALGVENLLTWAHELTHAADDRNGTITKLPGQQPDNEVVAQLGGTILLEVLGHKIESDRGFCWSYVKGYAEKARIEPIQACQRFLKRTCDCVALILDTAEETRGTAAQEPDTAVATA